MCTTLELPNKKVKHQPLSAYAQNPNPIYVEQKDLPEGVNKKQWLDQNQVDWRNTTGTGPWWSLDVDTEFVPGLVTRPVLCRLRGNRHYTMAICYSNEERDRLMVAARNGYRIWALVEVSKLEELIKRPLPPINK